MTTAVAPSTPLSAVDRCDRCGAQAYLRVELAGGGDLLFCAHHAREHGDKLREIAVAVQDETGKLVDAPAGAETCKPRAMPGACVVSGWCVGSVAAACRGCDRLTA